MTEIAGQWTAKALITLVVPLLVLIRLGVTSPKQRRRYGLFLFGWLLLYVLPMELRPYGQGGVGSWLLGVVPNFGFAFAFPLWFVQRRLSYLSWKRQLWKGMGLTLAGLLANELLSGALPYTFFDPWDLVASVLGLLALYGLLHWKPAYYFDFT